MRLMFKQRLFSWLDSYDIYDENGNVLFVVEGKFSFGHKLHINDCYGNHIATLQEEVLHLMPRFNLYIGNDYIGQIRRNFTLFKPSYTVDCGNLNVTGDLFGWNYNVIDNMNNCIATVSKELFRLTDTYFIDVYNDQYALIVLLIVLAIDAANCSRD